MDDDSSDVGFSDECIGTVCRACVTTIPCTAIDKLLSERTRPDPPPPELCPPDTLGGGGSDEG